MNSASTAQRSDIEQFLFDAREYFRASLETSEYENTSNIFHVSEAKSTLNLLQRCEELLKQYEATLQNNTNVVINGTSSKKTDDSNSIIKKPTTITTTTPVVVSTTTTSSLGTVAANGQPAEDVSYLNMTANAKTKQSGSKEYIAYNNSIDSEKIFRCSMKLEHISDSEDGNDDTSDNDDDLQIYDICQVSQIDMDEIQITENCPYTNLPAGHLAIQTSSKYGQLQRIEKRLFFDQCKKCYCGVLNDWLLCYEAPTSSQPNISLHLKNKNIAIEHSGEGKRREICFQITTADPNKKFVFQAINEVDAKEWIHAIEAAIRGDTAAVATRNNRKLPTPPVVKRMIFLGHAISNGSLHDRNGTTVGVEYTSIYEEPAPLNMTNNDSTDLLITTATENNDKSVSDQQIATNINESLMIAQKFEYDTPKCPPQPLSPRSDATQMESETAGLLNVNETNASLPNRKTAAKSSLRSSEKIDFQAKIKDVHNKLSSQLTVGPNIKKAVRKAYSCSSNDSEDSTLTSSASVKSPSSNKEQKKLKKSFTPSPNSQKSYNKNNNNNNNNNNNKNITDSLNNEKSAKNWFLNRLNKSNSSLRNSTSTSSSPNSKQGKQSEKENLLNNLDVCEIDGAEFQQQNSSSNPASPILKGNNNATNKSKVNMIINQFEANGQLAAMFSIETLTGNAVATFNTLCDSDCNTYEPIMAMSSTPNSFMKKV